VYRNYVDVEFLQGRDGRKDLSKLKRRKEQLEAKEKKQQGPTPAMILPFPCQEGDEKVDLIDLSADKYDTLFTHLGACFPHLEKGTKSRKRAAAKGVLKVEQCGSYSVSVARSLDDLKRIDTSVFTLAPQVDELLSKNYAQGYGFIVAVIRNNEKKHPLAYVHTQPAGHLFVPTRHQHGEEEEEDSHWDHEIYSWGTQASADAGESVEEAVERLKREAPARMRVVEGRQSPPDVLASLPVPLQKEGPLRVLHRSGTFRNYDVVLAQ